MINEKRNGYTVFKMLERFTAEMSWISQAIRGIDCQDDLDLIFRRSPFRSHLRNEEHLFRAEKDVCQRTIIRTKQIRIVYM